MRILYNARIRTLNPAQPQASAVAVEHGLVKMIGSDDEVLAEFDGRAKAQDMRGKVIWPGLTDAHIHLQYYSSSLQLIDCETSSREECLRRVVQKTRQVPPGEWVRGHGWNQNSWPDGFGTLSELDAAAPDHPVYLSAKSLHAAWVNSAALRQAGITKSTPDPEGGRIGRDENGTPNGLLFETALELVFQKIPAPSQAEINRSIEAAQSGLWQMGLTGVHDFDRRQCFSALQTMDQADKLRLRVVKSIPLEDLPHAVELGLRSGFGSQFLRIGSVKLFADGALGPNTAAMLQPYEENAENTGMLLLDQEQIFEYGRQAVSSGISLAIHAIGDRANHEVLSAFEQLRRFEQEIEVSALRHRIEHVQILHPNDYGKLAQLGIIASVQPIHATSDMYDGGPALGKTIGRRVCLPDADRSWNPLLFWLRCPGRITKPILRTACGGHPPET